MAEVLFQIENGVVGLLLVDTAEVGYEDSWQAPGGKGVDEVTIADYDAGAAAWTCQVTSGALNASANQNDVNVPATFCSPARTTPQPGETSYNLDLEWLQDIVVPTGLNRFLFEHDTKELYFLLGLNGDGDPPQAIGRVRAIAGAFGGPARDNLTATVSLPASRKPTIEFGLPGDSAVVNPQMAPVG